MHETPYPRLRKLAGAAAAAALLITAVAAPPRPVPPPSPAPTVRRGASPKTRTRPTNPTRSPESRSLHEGAPTSDVTESVMDLHNNDVGHQIARENPDASAAEIRSIVDQKIRDGELRLVDKNGNILPSNQYPIPPINPEPIVPGPRR
ncbi:MAG: DUF6973 domain-containing protein [Stackebrandtia sp.]